MYRYVKQIFFIPTCVSINSIFKNYTECMNSLIVTTRNPTKIFTDLIPFNTEMILTFVEPNKDCVGETTQNSVIDRNTVR